ncbi:DUF554 domain-containing protein [Parasporobacterium paucivorans]|uniref:Membrane protein YdfK n=1 Tax=Parasporobacterium paucivorans DSM 15970 TaxID=1122934 RepID=A0A1M6G7V2_9FIRM|nr:DUF554 domain-containing protein [Parasporobacterium paucivorans]SHJ05996.1 hypothetical protein SAMN02745691_01280 [Parasporobacterium paucivorans DSM 15970]
MPGLGTIVNALAIIIGATIGFFAKGKISSRFQKTIMQVIGLSTMFIGVNGVVSQMLTFDGKAFSTQYTMNMILFLVIGSIIGEAIDIEEKLDSFGEWCKRKFNVKNDGEGFFVEGFISSSLLFCIGAMAIIGSLEDGINHNHTILFTKSLMDGISALIFAASFGIGVYFSVVPLVIYQGLLTLLASVVSPFLTDSVIGQMSLVGSVLIFALGINLIFGKKVKVGNMLPAIFLPLLYGLLPF